MKVLIVDDSKAMRMIVKRTLRQAGFTTHEVQEAENGKLALDLIRTYKPDVVLSDWNMPEMTGIQLLEALATEPAKPKYFGFVTSEGSEDMRERARVAGALFVITKPFTADTFTQHLGAILV